jgi:hypothetical protein
MHEIQVTGPLDQGQQIANLAHQVGIAEISSHVVHVYGPDKQKQVLRLEANAPQAKQFLDALMSADFFDPHEYSIMSDHVEAIVSANKPAEITKPMPLPTMDVFQDLWMRIHISPSFLLRSVVSALLLSYGMLEDNLTVMIAAFLFTPFLDQAMAVSFGLLTQEWRMVKQGLLAILIATVLTFLAGMIVAVLMREPIQFDRFTPVLDSFLIALIVGVVATVAISDITGRRELIAMAAASEFAIYPAWFGLHVVLGMPGPEETMPKALSFVVNIVTTLVVTLIVYALLRHRREIVRSYSRPVGES